MSVVRLMEVCPFALCPSREKVVLKMNEHRINFLQPRYTDFKSVLRAHALTLEASSVQTAMVCSLSISLMPSLPASCNALDRSLSVPSQKTDAQEITDIKALSFQYIKIQFPYLLNGQARFVCAARMLHLSRFCAQPVGGASWHQLQGSAHLPAFVLASLVQHCSTAQGDKYTVIQCLKDKSFQYQQPSRTWFTVTKQKYLWLWYQNKT